MWAVICITVQDECWMCIGHIQRLPLTVYFLVSRVSSAITCSTCYFTPSVYLFPSVCPYTFPSLFVWVFFCLFVFAHVCCLQRFEGFRNDKTMPPSLEPSCSGSTEDGSITTNHLRLASTADTHAHIYDFCCCIRFCFPVSVLSWSPELWYLNGV